MKTTSEHVDRLSSRFKKELEAGRALSRAEKISLVVELKKAVEERETILREKATILEEIEGNCCS